MNAKQLKVVIYASMCYPQLGMAIYYKAVGYRLSNDQSNIHKELFKVGSYKY